MQDLIVYIIVRVCVIWAAIMIYRRFKATPDGKCSGCPLYTACQACAEEAECRMQRQKLFTQAAAKPDARSAQKTLLAQLTQRPGQLVRTRGSFPFAVDPFQTPDRLFYFHSFQ